MWESGDFLNLERKEPLVFIFLQFVTTCLGTLLIGCVWDVKSFDVIAIEDVLSLCFLCVLQVVTVTLHS